ncbi:MAG: hypothetical protein BWZ10_01345 [candidate division BRC1 bacterium ADurb.BinA364]|nr:MAG: hypothetical protein BWZ10_01345 [candidate division BRC1 bacterium ADurb.BinA364]
MPADSHAAQSRGAFDADLWNSKPPGEKRGPSTRISSLPASLNKNPFSFGDHGNPGEKVQENRKSIAIAAKRIQNCGMAIGRMNPIRARADSTARIGHDMRIDCAPAEKNRRRDRPPRCASRRRGTERDEPFPIRRPIAPWACRLDAARRGGRIQNSRAPLRRWPIALARPALARHWGQLFQPLFPLPQGPRRHLRRSRPAAACRSRHPFRPLHGLRFLACRLGPVFQRQGGMVLAFRPPGARRRNMRSRTDSVSFLESGDRARPDGRAGQQPGKSGQQNDRLYSPVHERSRRTIPRFPGCLGLGNGQRIQSSRRSAQRRRASPAGMAQVKNRAFPFRRR